MASFNRFSVIFEAAERTVSSEPVHQSSKSSQPELSGSSLTKVGIILRHREAEKKKKAEEQEAKRKAVAEAKAAALAEAARLEEEEQIRRKLLDNSDGFVLSRRENRRRLQINTKPKVGSPAKSSFPPRKAEVASLPNIEEPTQQPPISEVVLEPENTPVPSQPNAEKPFLTLEQYLSSRDVLVLDTPRRAANEGSGSNRFGKAVPLVRHQESYFGQKIIDEKPLSHRPHIPQSHGGSFSIDPRLQAEMSSIKPRSAHR